jgi:uncharacterized protein YqgC (DUF456 family)
MRDEIDLPRLLLTPAVAVGFVLLSRNYALNNGLASFYIPGLLASIPATVLLACYLIRNEERASGHSRSRAAWSGASVGLGLILFWTLPAVGILVVLLCGVGIFGALFLQRLHQLRRRRGSSEVK